MFAKLFEEHSHMAHGSDGVPRWGGVVVVVGGGYIFFLLPFHLTAPKCNDGMTWT